jgi:hypothetical protein
VIKRPWLEHPGCIACQPVDQLANHILYGLTYRVLRIASVTRCQLPGTSLRNEDEQNDLGNAEQELSSLTRD